MLTEQQYKEIENKLAELDKNSPMKLYWDYRDELSDEQISKILDGNIDAVYEEIWEWNIDNFHYYQIERLKEVFEDVTDDEDLDFEDYRDDLRDRFLDYLSVDINLKDLIDRVGSVDVNISLMSNFDCINSHHFETYGGGGYEMESYFGDMVNALNLNPKKVKQMLIEKDINVFGTWRNKPYRDGKEYVSYEDFWQELENSSCGANLLVFMAKLDLNQYLENKDINTIIIPKGNFCGLYSSFQGGGSVLEMELKRDIKLSLNIENYDGYVMEVDTNSNGYSINDVYGMCGDVWGNKLTILK